MSFRIAVEDGRFSRTLVVREDVTVGSTTGCGLRLESAGVARRHATLRQCGKKVIVETAGAKSPVEVAGRHVQKATLTEGQSIRVGEARVQVLDILPELRRRRLRSALTVPLRPVPAAISAVVHGVLLLIVLPMIVGKHVDAEPEVAFAIVPRERYVEPELPPPPPDLLEPIPLPETPKVDLDALLPPPPPPEADVPPAPPREDPKPELPPKPPAQETPAGSPDAPPDAPPGPPEPVAGTSTIGVGGGSVAGATGDGVARSFGKGEAGNANRRVAGMLEDDTGGGGATLRAVRGGAATSNVWVVRGDYDQAEKVLAELGVEHSVLGRDELETREIPASVRVLFYNCTGHALSREAQQRIAAWSYAGGWIVTTDWALERVLEKGFAGTLVPLRVNERPVLTKDETVGVRATKNTGLAEGMPFDDGLVARWWLEDASVPVVVPDGIGAEVLVKSEELERRCGAGAVAVTFPYGKGRVLHLLGHVYQQEGTLRGTMMVHRLVVNYLAGALKEPR